MAKPVFLLCFYVFLVAKKLNVVQGVFARALYLLCIAREVSSAGFTMQIKKPRQCSVL